MAKQFDHSPHRPRLVRVLFELRDYLRVPLQEGLERGYALHIGAYDRIFDRTGLEWYRVESDVGMMGGLGAHEYMAPCAAGENEVALSDAGYAANVDVASAEPAPVAGLPEPLAEPEPVDTPGKTTIEVPCCSLSVPSLSIVFKS
jgi:prolyl-tRNA synthetase